MLKRVVIGGVPFEPREDEDGLFILSIAHGWYSIEGGCRIWTGQAEADSRRLVLRPRPESFWESCSSDLDEALRGAVEASRGRDLHWTINSGNLTLTALNGPEFALVKLPSSGGRDERRLERYIPGIN
jgi:hypothetical protein